jgi:ribosomal protein L2
MLQPRLLLRQSSRTVCRHLALRQNLPRTYATVIESVEVPPPPSVAATTSGFAPPATVDDTNSKFMMRTYKPRTPGVRHLRRPINDHLWKGRPFLPLTFRKKGHGKGGRNNSGRVTIRHRGGGHKRRIRTVDFERMLPGKHTVERIEHDPGRTAHIALLNEEATGKKSYIVAAEGMRAGDVVQSYRAGIPKDLLESMGGVVDPGVLAAKTAWRGNCLPIHMIPIGTMIYNVGSTKGRGAVFCRSAGTYAIVVAKDDDAAKKRSGSQQFVTVRLQSGEIRKVSRDACATVGVASNPHYQHTQLGKAGRKRWLNIRPTVRGLAMNAGRSSPPISSSSHS